MKLNPEEQRSADESINEAFLEDFASQEDITTNSLVPSDATGAIRIISRSHGILSGISIARRAFEIFDPKVTFRQLLNDGDSLIPQGVIAEVSGSVRSLLTVERTALNFLTMLSGISTLTGQFVAAVEGTKTQILDTRKTHPGLRSLQKYAVRCGGGTNHRIGLYDAILIKDNHLAWFTTSGQNRLGEAILKCRSYAPDDTVVEVEVDSLEQLREILPAKPDIVLLDNMTEDQLREAVLLRNQSASSVLLEASGGVNLNTVSGISETGVDRISIGALTHSAAALDIGFDWRFENSNFR